MWLRLQFHLMVLMNNISYVSLGYQQSFFTRLVPGAWRRDGSRQGGTALTVLASQQCDPGSVPGPGVVVVGSLVSSEKFPSWWSGLTLLLPQKPALRNSNSVHVYLCNEPLLAHQCHVWFDFFKTKQALKKWPYLQISRRQFFLALIHARSLDCLLLTKTLHWRSKIPLAKLLRRNWIFYLLPVSVTPRGT